MRERTDWAQRALMRTIKREEESAQLKDFTARSWIQMEDMQILISDKVVIINARLDSCRRKIDELSLVSIIVRAPPH